MTTLPNMKARDSSGRKISLLNEEPPRQSRNTPRFQDPNHPRYDAAKMIRSSSNSDTSTPSNASSSPTTPGLMRADSFDSQNTNDPLSPTTPTCMAEYGRQTLNTGAFSHKQQAHHEPHEAMSYNYSPRAQYMPSMRPYADSRTPSFIDQKMYEEDHYQNDYQKGGGKRYPCRFKDSHGCDRTFTTSGHASRHSKIHTAEKAVHCTYQGCSKKFTRADNMKQHLETHYKDKSRSTAAQKAAVATAAAAPSPVATSSKSPLTMPAGVRKSSPPTETGRSSRTPSRAEPRPELSPLDPAMFSSQYTASSPAGASPTSYCPLNMGGFQEALVSQPPMSAQPSPPNGLDALAFAADYQQNQT